MVKKKLYFHEKYDSNTVKFVYRALLTEQDTLSAHRYIESYESLSGYTLFDIGSAEGLFSLEVIDIVEHIYLFECDTNWNKALEATFAPWKHKVTIIPKYVNHFDDDKNVFIDAFLSNISVNKIFLKMDIEGFEQAALNGALNTLKKENNIQCSICTYHKKRDAKEIENFFKDLQMHYTFTEGYLYFDKAFRKGAIQA